MTEREVSLKQWLEKIGGSFGLNLKTLRPASSDAGFRSYFRIDGDGTTYIVMDSPREPGNVKPFILSTICLPNKALMFRKSTLRT